MLMSCRAESSRFRGMSDNCPRINNSVGQTRDDVIVERDGGFDAKGGCKGQIFTVSSPRHENILLAIRNASGLEPPGDQGSGGK